MRLDSETEWEGGDSSLPWTGQLLASSVYKETRQWNLLDSDVLRRRNEFRLGRRRPESPHSKFGEAKSGAAWSTFRVYHAQIEARISEALVGETRSSISESPKSRAVPAPREVISLPSSTTRSLAKMFFNSPATDGCAV